MAKELPFFKFNVSEWLTGDISYESYELQGLFIKVCAEYWNRNNKMTIESAKQRTREPELVEQLVQKGYILKKRNAIFISFLDEERGSIEAKSLKLSNAGRKGGLSSAQGRLKHKEIEIDIEVDKEIEVDKDKDKDKDKEKKEPILHWNEDLPTGIKRK